MRSGDRRPAILSHHNAGPASRRPVPTAAPVAQPVNRECEVHKQWPGESGTTYPDVPDPGPSTIDGTRGAVAVWYPDMNAQTCRAELTHIAPATAQRLAHTMMQLPKSPPGKFSCPSDNGLRVILYFTSKDQQIHPVEIQPTGCGRVYTYGQTPTKALSTEWDKFRFIAPPAWKTQDEQSRPDNFEGRPYGRPPQRSM